MLKQSTPEMKTEHKEAGQQPIKVLVVEDSDHLREFIIEYMLKPHGFAVEVAANGLDGLTKALHTAPDLILLDYELPTMDGMQILRRLRQKGVKTPVIVMTSHGSEHLAIEVFNLGVQNYLPKPFDLSKALQAISDALQVTYLEQERQKLIENLKKANQELQHQVDLMNVMYEIGKAITLIHPSQMLQRIAEAALFLSHADEARLYLLNPRTGQLAGPYHSRRAGQVEVAPHSHTQIAVDLLVSGKKVGVLGVAIPLERPEPEQAECRRMLELLSGYACIAIQNLSYLNQLQARKEQEKRQIRGVFEKYVATPVVEQLLKHPEQISLGGKRQVVTILFADLRGFSSFSSTQSPEQVVETTNLYIQAAVEAILSEEGTLDKFFGDAVMAFFNAPLPQPDHALRAVRAALKLRQTIVEAHRHLAPEYHLNFGLGICTGEAVVGNVGAVQLMSYTAVGNSVNKAFRLQESAQGGQILVDRAMLDFITPAVITRQIGQIHLKGQPEVEPVFEVIGLQAQPVPLLHTDGQGKTLLAQVEVALG